LRSASSAGKQVILSTLAPYNRIVLYNSLKFYRDVYIPIGCEHPAIEYNMSDVFGIILPSSSLFSVVDRNFLSDRKKLSQFGHNVRKCRLVSTITASFNTSMGQMTETSSRKSLDEFTQLGLIV